MVEQINMFDVLECLLSPEKQKFRKALKRGSGFENGKERIKTKAKELSKTEFVNFLKKEYGLGGSSFENGFIDYSNKGFIIYEDCFTKQTKYSWTQVADEILNMLETNSY